MKSGEYISIIIFILVLFILLLWYHHRTVHKICNTKESLDYFTFKCNKLHNLSFPKILFVAGTHGNEPAGSISLTRLLHKLTTNELQLNKGQLTIVPKVNNCGIQTDSRFIPLIWDLNRKYPSSIKESYKMINRSKTINDAICQLVVNSDFILDMHEGWSFHKQNKSSVGSTLTPTIGSIPNLLSMNIVNKLNETLPENKKFMIMTDDDNLVNNKTHSKNKEIKGTLRNYCSLLNKDYILVETTGQNNVQPIEKRIEQCDLIIKEILKHFKLIN